MGIGGQKGAVLRNQQGGWGRQRSCPPFLPITDCSEEEVTHKRLSCEEVVWSSTKQRVQVELVTDLTTWEAHTWDDLAELDAPAVT